MLKSSENVFIGEDSKILALLDPIELIARTDATILICGESGTGKEVIARIIHEKSKRCQKPFIAINCGAIAETLQESELFGHTKGAFTGAISRKFGKFEIADSGTIFLDEINEMSAGLQVKLLRILQFGEYAPVGSAENLYCDARIIASTNQDLAILMEKGRFRKDLYYRINTIRLEIPALREHKSDIPLLVEHFIKINQNGPLYNPVMSQQAMDLLLNYDYPGNIRELENIIKRAIILSQGKTIQPAHLPLEVMAKPSLPRPSSKTFHEAKSKIVERFERRYLTRMLKQSHGIIARAAVASGLSERNFHEKLKKYNISGKEFR